MRIQHNIMAMNAYRNYTNNTSMLSKNLEKLSSGYKINRAGDDAAGLAISEKMRAQITGLSKAQDNAQDGISLIQTAEGALTEVHDMLNRMTELAEQSANGTYEEVDRDQLQKEFDRLTEEINRIADASNFNGIKLLDGSLSGTGDVSGVGLTDVAAVPGVTKSVNFATASAALSNGDKISYTVAWKDGTGEYSATVNFTVDTTNHALVAEDGTTYSIADTTDHKATAAEQMGAIVGELKKNSSVSSAFDIAADTSAISFTSKVAGTDGATITALSMTSSGAGLTATPGIAATGNTAAADAYQELDLSKVTVLAGTETADAMNKAVFEVGGKKFVLADQGATATQLKNLGSDVTVIKLDGTAGYQSGEAATVADTIGRVTGLKITGDTTTGKLKYEGDEKLSTSGGLKLQIGDTGEDFNQITVSINSIKSGDLVDMTEGTGLSLAELKISDADSAMTAMSALRGMINYVSDVRGGLGATQNRLEHTINNLSVMEENIQNAESAIRDTDVAEEMMAYTKNNILIQSAQAMLAQANQVPQGVLQLLQ